MLATGSALALVSILLSCNIVLAQTFQTTEVTNANDGLGVDAVLHNDEVYYSHISQLSDLRFTEKINDVWTTVEVVEDISNSTDPKLETALVFDDSDEPHIFFYHRTDGDLKHAYRSAGNWTVETIDTANDTGAYPHAIRCQTDKFCVCYQDVTNGNLSLAIGDTGAWSAEDADTGANEVGQTCALALATDGHLYVAHFDATARRLKLATRTPLGVWSNETAPSAGSDIGLWPSIAIEHDDQIVIYSSAYKADDLSSADEAAWYSAKSSQGNWVSGSNESPFYGDYPHVSFDSDGREKTAYRSLRFSALFGNSGSIRLINETAEETFYSSLGLDEPCFPRYRFLKVF